MRKYRAIEKGYFGDVIHDPETDHHVIFEAPDDFSCTWAVPVDDDAEPEPEPEVTDETLEAEAQLDTESAAAAPTVDESDDANKAAGVETL